MIKPDLVVLDVDGVLTDGSKQYVDGKPVAKWFNDKDFTAIKILRAKYVGVCFLTADKNNQALAEDRNIDCFVSRDVGNRIDKLAAMQRVLEHYRLGERDEIWGVGDDLFDVEWLITCDQSFCPYDAASLVQSSVTHVLDTYGGEGVIQEVVERFLSPITKEDIKRLTEIDSHEGWSNVTRELDTGSNLSIG